MNLKACAPLHITSAKPVILLGWGMNAIAHLLKDRYKVIDIATDYSSDIEIPSLNGILSGELSGAVIKSGKFIDSAALAFIAKEAGWIVTTLDGSILPPLHTCKNYSLPGLIIAASKSVHQDLLSAMQSVAV
ncbi:hypothetical protein [Nostoc commune]|uniref:hypothetical protein n=1 Tax=Nostoc commune TaxID=1178 RepID=UPI0018C47C72|nr:hypothetical protein [Nostoc commune]